MKPDGNKKTIKVGEKDIPVDEYNKMRRAGKIVFRPPVKNGQVVFSNGRIHMVDGRGAHRNLTPRVRMSKKERRRMRRVAFEEEAT